MVQDSKAGSAGDLIGDSQSVQSILARSAQGASFLISLQIFSRAITFIVNQTLVRFLSPELLGISSQLELFAVTVLTFARESIRVALGRSGSLGTEENKDPQSRERKGKQTAASYESARKAQEAINLSYIALILGPVIASFFSWLYWRNPKPAVLAMPYIKESFTVYAAATILELLAEPSFSVAAQQTLFKTRAAAEGGATFARCMTNCVVAVWASKLDIALGPLPFAIGQLSFAIVLNAVYHSHIVPRSQKDGYSIFFRKIKSNSSNLIASRLPRRHFNLALSLYAQSGLKHILTQGDSVLIAWFTDLRSQGVYALASNYGSLLARMVFQPIEESSRGVFGGLTSAVPPSSNLEKPPSPHPNLVTAHKYLITVLRLYSLLSCGLFFVAPSVFPPLLPFLAGPKFASASGAPQVFGLYAYYLPLLAFNGLLEAFVAATASPDQLKWQAGAMMAFSAIFAGAGALVLGHWGKGARGLVGVNCINMAVRIIWSFAFARRYFRRRGIELQIQQFMPGAAATSLGIGVATLLTVISEVNDSFVALLKVLAIGGSYGLALILLERRFLLDCYRILKPKKNEPPTTSDDKKSL